MRRETSDLSVPPTVRGGSKEAALMAESLVRAYRLHFGTAPSCKDSMTLATGLTAERD